MKLTKRKRNNKQIELRKLSLMVFLIMLTISVILSKNINVGFFLLPNAIFAVIGGVMGVLFSIKLKSYILKDYPGFFKNSSFLEKNNPSIDVFFNDSLKNFSEKDGLIYKYYLLSKKYSRVGIFNFFLVILLIMLTTIYHVFW